MGHLPRHRIHIVGIAPRTGTTLLVEAMRACFAIDAVDGRERPLSSRALGARIHLSKAVWELPNVGPRIRLDPRLHVICMIRDPRDVVVSKHWTSGELYFTSLAHIQARLPALRSLQNHPRFITVRYEDLVTDPSAVQQSLENRLPFLERIGAFSNFHLIATDVTDRARANMHGLRPIDTGSIGSWRNHLPRVVDQLQGMTPVLMELGYEADGAWEHELAGVARGAADSTFRWPARRGLWLPPSVRGPIRDAWYALQRPLGSWARGKTEGLRGLAEFLLRSPRV